MAKRYDIQPVQTYANAKNAEAAVRKFLPNIDTLDVPGRWSILYTADGRCYPVFFGISWMQHGVQEKFNVVAF